MMKIRTSLVVAGVIATTIALTSCSSDADSMAGMHESSGTSATSSPPAESKPFNEQDIEFAQMMTAHHQAAVEMADTLLAKTGVPEDVTRLAENIKAAQQPEIEMMTEWLTEWGASTSHASGEGHAGDGMMSDSDMKALEQASGADAGRLFLQQMIEHHQGAIEMAETENDSGENADAVALSHKIVTDQTAEITEMQAMLDSL